MQNLTLSEKFVFFDPLVTKRCIWVIRYPLQIKPVLRSTCPSHHRLCFRTSRRNDSFKRSLGQLEVPGVGQEERAGLETTGPPIHPQRQHPVYGQQRNVSDYSGAERRPGQIKRHAFRVPYSAAKHI